MSQYLDITLIQASLAWEDKQANLARFEDKIRALPAGAELVVLPEMFSTGFSMNPAALAETMEGETIRRLRQLSVEKRVVITGSIIIEEDGRYFNRLVWVLPDGKLGTYDKKHLFAFAGEHKFYTAGTRRLVASVKGWRINLLVCYDLRFPVWSRQQSTEDPEYDVLIYVANWPERRSHAWKTLLQARAIENQCYVIGVNRVGVDGNGINHSGDSMVIDPMGEVLYQKSNEEDVFSIRLSREHLDSIRSKLPFLKDADDFRLMPGD